MPNSNLHPSPHRYLFALSVLLFASNGQAFAQSSAESRVDKLEETVRILDASRSHT